MNPRYIGMNFRNPKKVDSKPERGERVYKRAAEAQRDLFRKRRSKETDEWLIFCRRQKNKPEQSELCSDVSSGSKKDAMRFGSVGLESTQFYLHFNILDFLTLY